MSKQLFQFPLTGAVLARPSPVLSFGSNRPALFGKGNFCPKIFERMHGGAAERRFLVRAGFQRTSERVRQNLE